MLKKQALVSILAAGAAAFSFAAPVAAQQDPAPCRTDYSGQGLTEEQIREYCEQEREGGSSGGGESTGEGNEYPSQGCNPASRLNCFGQEPK